MHSLVIPCAPKSTQQSTVKAGLSLYNAGKRPVWSPLSHENLFFSKRLWLLWKMCPLFTESMPSASATLWCFYFSFLLVNLTWFQFSDAPLSTVKMAFCVRSSWLVGIRTAVTFAHVCIFSRGRWGPELASPSFIFGGWLTGYGNGSANTPCHQLSHCTFP